MKHKKIKITKLCLVLFFAFYTSFNFIPSAQATLGEDCAAKGGKCKHNWLTSNCDSSSEDDLGYLDCISGSCCKPKADPTPDPAQSSLNYVPMENIPGFEGVGGEFPAYIVAVYRFGIWTIGIAALLMIMIGGFMYITSAGNNSQMTKAKGIITDALIGVIMALASYLILYTINPDLLKISNLSPVGSPGPGVPPSEEPAPPLNSDCTGGRCGKLDAAIQNNSYGIDSVLLKAIIDGGEGCNSANSPRGACGYSQVMPIIRNAYCNGATCDQLRSDPQLDVNCGAAYIKAELLSHCQTNARCVGACYNLGITICKKNPSACGERNYCQRVEGFYNNCKK